MLPVNNGNPHQVMDNLRSMVNATMQVHAPLQPLWRIGTTLRSKLWITQALYKSINIKNKM